MTRIRSLGTIFLTLCIPVIFGAGCGRSEKVDNPPELVQPLGVTQPASDASAVSPAALTGSEPSTLNSGIETAESGNKGKQGDVKRTTSEEPDADSLRLAASVLGKQSDAYELRGYAGLTFGTSKDALAAKNLIVGKLQNSEFFHLKDDSDALFTPSGELVGIATKHSERDNERALAKLKDLFGPPETDNIEKFVRVNTASGNRDETLRVTYHFPESVVVVRFVYEASVTFNGSRTKTEQTFVAVFDRRWVVQELAADIQQKRKSVEWLRGLVVAGQAPGFDRSALPAWVGAQTQEKAFPASTSVYWTAMKPKEVEDKTPPRIEKIPDPDWFAAISTLTYSNPDNPKGTIFSTLRFPNVPGLKQGLIERSTLHYLIGRTNSSLAQEAFPPGAETITVKSTGLAKNYEWLTKDYLKVQVKSDNSLVVTRSPN